MPDSSTPLSDWITRCIEQNTRENYEHFLQVFLGSQLGVILQGIPQGASGQVVVGKNELSAAMSSTPDGKRMLLACADRAVFVQRFKRPFNAEMGAVALLKMALANPRCEGIMINSAASEHTILIPRVRVAELIARRNVSG
ncbi:MAG TPA: SseB family protein [Candidatus Acidoferrum sp.]|nr:SseB family protein [Candidatus Acidoferrum sp.]